ncbi:hypothetical protein QQM79_14370 [Marinobacteraceae bacterium S3BR75-40.1]
MNLISFDAYRTLHFPATRFIKPELYLNHREELQQADWVLFPEYWQVNALVFGLKCRIFPSLPSYLIGHDKVAMTRAFNAVAPANTPWTLIEANGPQEREMIWDTLPHPFVAKLPKASMGEGVWLIENRADWQRYCEITNVLYAQEYLPIDRDIRVIVVGNQVVSAYWRHQAEQGFYNNVARGGWIDHGQVPDSALELALRVSQQLGVDHAGFDIAMVGTHPFLLEFNRLFGNQGIRPATLLRDRILAHLGRLSSPDDPGDPGPTWPVAV